MYIQNNHIRRTIPGKSMELQDRRQTHDARAVVNVCQGWVACHPGPPLTARWYIRKGETQVGRRGNLTSVDTGRIRASYSLPWSKWSLVITSPQMAITL